ncbi:hypothetical protein MMPV_004128 [Pyropia vietnamensis]
MDRIDARHLRVAAAAVGLTATVVVVAACHLATGAVVAATRSSERVVRSPLINAAAEGAAPLRANGIAEVAGLVPPAAPPARSSLASVMSACRSDGGCSGDGHNGRGRWRLAVAASMREEDTQTLGESGHITDDPDTDDPDGLSPGAIAGIAVGSVAGAALVVAAIVAAVCLGVPAWCLGRGDKGGVGHVAGRKLEDGVDGGGVVGDGESGKEGDVDRAANVGVAGGGDTGGGGGRGGEDGGGGGGENDNRDGKGGDSSGGVDGKDGDGGAAGGGDKGGGGGEDGSGDAVGAARGGDTPPPGRRASPP